MGVEFEGMGSHELVGDRRDGSAPDLFDVPAAAAYCMMMVFVVAKNIRRLAAVIGARANIGAGTITCNFDGQRKHETEIGKDAFIGSNSSLVAPVKIGARGLTGAGSVVIADVDAGERVAGNPARPLKPKALKAERKPKNL